MESTKLSEIMMSDEDEGDDDQEEEDEESSLGLNIQSYEEVVVDGRSKNEKEEDEVPTQMNPVVTEELKCGEDDVIVTEMVVNEEDENTMNVLRLEAATTMTVEQKAAPIIEQQQDPLESTTTGTQQQLPIVKTYIKTTTPDKFNHKRSILKIVPQTTEKSHKIVMKIQHKENTPEKSVDLTLEDHNHVKEEIRDDTEDTVSLVDYDEDSSPPLNMPKTKIRREVKQLQKMMDSSKVLTDFMSDPNKIRKSRKLGTPVPPPKLSPGDLDASPTTLKRQNMRSSNAEFSQKQRKFLKNIQSVENMDLEENAGEIEHQFEQEEEMSDNTDNETNESIASVDSKRTLKPASSLYVIVTPPKVNHLVFLKYK